MLDVEQWAQIRRMHVVDGVSIKEIVRRTGLARNTVRAAVRADKPPSYERGPRPSKLDPFKEEIERLLRADHRMPGTRIRELIAELGYEGAETISTSTGARCGRALRPGAPTSAPSTDPGRSVSSTSGSRGQRSPLAAGRPAGAGLSRALGFSRRRRSADLLQAGP